MTARRDYPGDTLEKLSYASAQWFEIWVIGPHDVPSTGHRVDRRRRSKATAEHIAAELRASRNFLKVWLVEINRLKASREEP